MASEYLTDCVGMPCSIKNKEEELNLLIVFSILAFLAGIAITLAVIWHW